MYIYIRTHTHTHTHIKTHIYIYKQNPYHRAGVRPITSYLKNYPSKVNNECESIVEKQALIHK